MNNLDTVFELTGPDGKRYTIEFHPDRINLRDEDGFDEWTRVSPTIQMVLLVNFNHLVELLDGKAEGVSFEQAMLKREIESMIEDQKFWTPPDEA